MEKKVFKHLYQSSEDIPLILNSYEDIFSDFDPRDYLVKAISVDFLLECKRASMDKKGRIKLRLFVPKNKKDSSEEIKIKKRLKEHFNKHLNEKKREIDKIRISGFNWFIVGCVMIILAAWFINYPNKEFWLNLMVTLTHPAGWFFMWEGLGKIFITAKEKRPDYDFYKKMVNSIVSFVGY